MQSRTVSDAVSIVSHADCRFVPLQAGRFEGKALDNSVVVTLNGKMEPLSCTVRGCGNNQDRQFRD